MSEVAMDISLSASSVGCDGTTTIGLGAQRGVDVCTGGGMDQACLGGEAVDGEGNAPKLS